MIKTHLSLVLIDGFLQSNIELFNKVHKDSHNPYFNRWFSAIMEYDFNIISEGGHNPYFNRWFSAMRVKF